MREVVYLTGKEPMIADIARAVGYTGRKFQLEVVPEGGTIDVRSYWDSGSRSTFRFYNLANGRCTAEVPTMHPYYDGQIRGAEAVPLPDGVACVEHHIFTGTDMGLRIHVSAANVAGLLPKHDDGSLTTDMKIVLAATRGLKPSYNGISNYRLYEAKARTGITEARWNDAKAACIAAKLLNKAGAITPEGRNAIGRTELYDLRAA